MPRHRSPSPALFLTGLVLAASVVAGRGFGPDTRSAPAWRWYRGNLHTHSLWSDGDDYPEMIVAWYKEHGYHFLALSEHNVLPEGKQWIDPTQKPGGAESLARYKARFGPGWVEEQEIDGKRLVRLKPLAEFRHLFEEPGRFLLMTGEEITDRFVDPGGVTYPVHLGATNLREVIPPRGGSSVLEVLQHNVDAVRRQSEFSGQAMLVQVNHPNFGWAVTAEDLARVKGCRFFEVHNGHPKAHNDGDDQHLRTDRLWDIALALRLAEGEDRLLYGVAVDDAHDYHKFSGQHANPGRGWVVVRASHLTPESIIAAMRRGDFYASTGVRLRDIRFDGQTLQIDIDAQEGVVYRTQFIGTRRGYDPTSQPVLGENEQELHITRTYSDEVGQVLAESDRLEPSYKFQGDELYVRARIVSSKPHPSPVAKGDREMAWTQPVVSGKPVER